MLLGGGTPCDSCLAYAVRVSNIYDLTSLLHNILIIPSVSLSTALCDYHLLPLSWGKH